MDRNYINNMSSFGQLNDVSMSDSTPVTMNSVEVPSTVNAVAAAAIAVASMATSASALTHTPGFPQNSNLSPAYNVTHNITGFDNNSVGSTSPHSASRSASVSPDQPFPSNHGYYAPAPVPTTPYTSATYAHHQHSRPDFNPVYSWSIPRYGTYPAEYTLWSQLQSPQWRNTSYTALSLQEASYQTTLRRRPLHCGCLNCFQEMNGLPPLMGPDERGRKQHICSYPGCTRHYSKASHLRNHVRWHTGERPYECTACNKRFSRSDELHRHIRVHTNYRPYKCPLCTKSFSRSDHLSKHKKTHDKAKKGKKASAQQKQQQAKARSNKLQSTGTPPQTAQNIKQEPTEKISAGIAAITVSASVPICDQAEGTSVATNLPARATESNAASATVGQANPMRLPQHLNGYPNLYQQSQQLFHSYHSGAASTYGGLYQTPEATMPQQHSTSFELWNQHYRQQQCNSFDIQQQQQQQQQQQTPQENAATGITTASNLFNNSAAAASAALVSNTQQLHQQQLHQQQQQQLNSSSILSSQHYAALSMQSESHLNVDYGFPAPSNTADIVPCSTASIPNYMQNGAAVAPYPGCPPIKSENSTYPDYASTSRASWNMHHYGPN